MLKNYDQPASSLTVGVDMDGLLKQQIWQKPFELKSFSLKRENLAIICPRKPFLKLARLSIAKGNIETNMARPTKRNGIKTWKRLCVSQIFSKKVGLGAIGILRIEEVLEREDIADRFYGWDVTLGSRFDITLPFTGQDRSPANLDVSASYARPIAWRWQVSERISMNTPFDNFGTAFSSSLSSDISYELSNRIDVRLRHLLQLEKLEADDAKISHALGASFIYYIENNLNLVVTEQITKAPEQDIISDFTVVLNYRVF